MIKALTAAVLFVSVPTSALAAAVSVSPTVGGTLTSFHPYPNYSDRYGCSGGTGNIASVESALGRDSSHIMTEGFGFVEERRGNFEFELSPSFLRSSAVSTLTFTVGDAYYGSMGMCVFAYKADGQITAGDYDQTLSGTLLGGLQYYAVPDSMQGIYGAPRNYQFDLTGFMSKFRPQDGNFLGIQIMSDFSDGGARVSNVRLNVASVPEPAALGLFGMGMLGIAAWRRRKAA